MVGRYWRGRESGYVYIARCGSLYKIGLTQKPSQRAASLRRLESSCHYSFVKEETDQGYRPEILYYFQVQNMIRTESALHIYFQSVRCYDKVYSCRRYTEWFRLSPEQVAWFCTLTSKDEERLCRTSQC